MKTALLFGSSGLIGGHLLNKLLENNDYSKIKLFVRSVSEINNPKVEIIKTDFNNLESHKEDIKGDDCFFCIGTTKKNSPDKNEYRRIELDVPKKVAQIARFTKCQLPNSDGKLVLVIWECMKVPKQHHRHIRVFGVCVCVRCMESI